MPETSVLVSNRQLSALLADMPCALLAMLLQGTFLARSAQQHKSATPCGSTQCSLLLRGQLAADRLHVAAPSCQLM